MEVQAVRRGVFGCVNLASWTAELKRAMMAVETSHKVADEKCYHVIGIVVRLMGA